jgi:adenosylcobinamide kinase/adenosylcobinamide-phosphate guanylyltransferase
MAQLTLVVGGIRSGKSRFAEQLAGNHPPVTYLATAAPPPPPSGPDPGDDSMSRRIARHRQRRASMTPPWQTVEEPWDVPAILRSHGSQGCVLVECLTLWVSNLLLGLPGRAALENDDILAKVTNLADAGQEVPARVVVVSNEVGCGIIPMDALARRFGDLLGEANQKLAALATEVYGCLAGIPLRAK